MFSGPGPWSCLDFYLAMMLLLGTNEPEDLSKVYVLGGPEVAKLPV